MNEGAHPGGCTTPPSAGLVRASRRQSPPPTGRGDEEERSPLRHPAPSLTFSSSSFLLRGGTEALEHHAVLGALHPDLLVQDPEKAPGVLSTSSGWQAHLEGDPGYTEEPPERDFSSHLGSRGSVAQAS